MAFLVLVKFSVYGDQIECRGCVLHTLIGRYVLLRKIRNLWMKMLKFGVSTTKRHYLAHIQNVLNLLSDSMNQTSK
ncbi:hypothetical protein F4W18_15125 [Vibrio gigantis]|uniref:Uncharacterized protein n=1 Tax=Vibrio gigantis TaxID=296199 RepID=A0A5M9NNU9_9VIBR|nr:hypothetical protein F4W18_15125 [Vibrio gigantis]